MTYATGDIYGIVCPETQRIVYVGQSVIIENRIKNHISVAKHPQPYLRAKIYVWLHEIAKKQRLDELKYVILEEDVSREMLNEREDYWINVFIESGASLMNMRSPLTGRMLELKRA